MRALPLAWLLVLAPIATWAAPERASAQSLEETRDQGILYFKKERFRPAKDQLDRAYKMPGGDKDFATVFYRAQAAYKLLLLEVAFEMAEKAKALAGEDKNKAEKVDALVQEMSDLYGGVTIKPAQGETNTEGRIFLETKTGIINKEKKQTFMSIRERFRSVNVRLPATIYLPYGDYLANNVPFSLVQGEPPPTVELYLQVVRDDTAPEDSNTWLYVGIGAGVAAAAGVAAFFLLRDDTPRTEESVRIPVINSASGLRVLP
jgi:hypothetical protein